MKCSKIRSLLELALQDDVTESAGSRLARHLDHCSACREYAAGIEPLPLPMLRQEQPLSSSDLAAIRRSVLTSISAEEKSRFGHRGFRLAAAVVALLFLSLTFFIVSRGMSIDGEIPDAEDTATANVDQPARIANGDATPDVEASEVSEESSTAIVVTREREIEMTPPVAVASGQEDLEPPRGRETPPESEDEPPQLATNEKEEPSIRIELRTKDPTVRIIWLVSNQPELPADETSNINHSISAQEKS